MLFKNLKAILIEADEEAEKPEETETADGNTDDKPLETEKRRIPRRDIKNVKDASDGVGNEAYDLSIDISLALKTSLKEVYDIEKIKVKNNTIEITSKGTQLMSKRTGFAVPEDMLKNFIENIIMASTERDQLKPFDLKIEEIDAGILNIAVVPKEEV